MPKSPNQKLKLLIIRDYLLKNTDATHSVTVNDIIEELARNDIAAERKAIYDDLNLLGEYGYGMDIVSKRGRYSVATRDFSPQEIRLLVDMVQSSNFITTGKTRELIKKLNSLMSVYDARELKGQVYVRNRIKAMNESVYQNVDTVSDAIANDSRLRFKYYRYNVHKQKELRNGGFYHEVSPFALIWVDQNYYLLAYNPDVKEMRHFRVDRMSYVSCLPGPREGKELFAKTDMASYTSKVFYMFTGEEKPVRLRFENRFSDTVIDRFGTDVILIPDGSDHFIVKVEVAVSPQFYAWLVPFSTGVEILSPDDVRRGMQKHLEAIVRMYAGEGEK